MHFASHTTQRPLLPSGLSDRLPPLAAASLRTTSTLMQCFMGFGYDPVTPSILEYTETMLAGIPSEAAEGYFQFQDPLSNRVLALRADMTSQISRIATSTLATAARPLRLSYAGQRVRATPEALHTRREHRQIGIEYIGATDLAAEAEVISIAEMALKKIGLKELTLDVHLPVLLTSTIKQLPQAKQSAALNAAWRKDKEALRACGADLLADLLDVRGSLAEVSNFLKAHKHPVMYASNQLDALAEALEIKGCGMALQVDALEITQNSTYSGLSFSIFSSNPAFEVARGGRYTLKENEQAVGFTLYLDDVLAYLPPHPALPRVAVPVDTTTAQAHTLQMQGYTTIFTDEADALSLQRAGITHRFHNSEIIAV